MFHNYTICKVLLCAVDGFEMPEELDARMQGLEPFESIMMLLGLSERKPVPDTVRFTEADPLGSSNVARTSTPDFLSMGEFKA